MILIIIYENLLQNVQCIYKVIYMYIFIHLSREKSQLRNSNKNIV